MTDAPPDDREPSEATAVSAELTGSADPEATGRGRPEDDRGSGLGFALNLSFRSRLTLGLMAAAILPLAGFGVVVLIAEGRIGPGETLGRILLFAIVTAAVIGVLLAYLLAADLISPLRAIAAAVDRVSAGDLSTPIEVPGEDELARLADSHNRLAATLERRNRELGRILAAIESASPRDGADFLAGRAATDARSGVRDDRLLDPARRPARDRRARSGSRARRSRSGPSCGPARRTSASSSATCRRPAAGSGPTRTCSSCSRARSPSRSATPSCSPGSRPRTRQLLELDAAKDDFLRGVSHNLQTPLTSIRAYAHQLQGDRPDRRLEIIAEQSERLSRMVRQLLTVTRLESGRAPPAERGAVAWRRRSGGPGRRSPPPTSRSPSTTGRRAGSPSPTATSSTRSSGRCSTTR